MASTNQDFVTYVGDSISPIFTVVSTGTTAVNISTVTEITWYAKRDLASTAVATKTKSAGDITFVTDGTDGKFQLALTGTDTAALSGTYLHFAAITDASGDITTVTVGQMTVGPAPTWSYDPGQVGTSDLHTIRRLVGDTRKNDQLLFDAEVNWAASVYSNVWLAGAECARNIAANFARDIDTQQGELRNLYSSRTKAYRALAIDLEMRGMARGGGTAYAGGISQSDKDDQVTNTDRVTPQFNIGMMDDLIPVGPVGHETPTSPSSVGDDA